MVSPMPHSPAAEGLRPAASGTLIVIDESEETARLIESHMRNAGHPLRAAWVADFEELEDGLRRGAPDLVMCSLSMPDMPLRAVVSMCRKASPLVPVLALAPSLSVEEAVAAMSGGAVDLVSCVDPRLLRHLELVCVREFLNHFHQRELRTTRLRLSDFESRHHKLLEGTADAVVHIHEGILTHVNPAFAELLGFPHPDELVGLLAMDIVAPQHQPKVKEHIKLLNKGKIENQPLECLLRNREGAEIPVAARLTRGSVDGEHFIEMLIRGKSAPTTTLAGTAAAQPALAHSDRLALFEALEQPTASGQPRALALLTPDAYANLETQLGFLEVELLMQQLDEQLAALLVHEDDAVYRFGTEQFAVLVHGVSPSQLPDWCRQLRETVASHILAAGTHEAQITISLAAHSLAAGETAESAVARLATELRKIVGKGSNQSVVVGGVAAGTGDDVDARRAADISRALEENRFKLAYQSIASLEGDTRQHFDVLARMIDASGRELHASEFIATAEKHGLMRQLDRWVIMRALKVLNKREGSRSSSILFVKISEDTLQEADAFLAWLLGLLKQRPLKHEEVCFEIQEAVLQNHIRKAKMLTRALRDAGAGIAIEHFGIGNNSAQVLDHVPASFIKFHKSFTSNFADKEVQRKMTTLIEIAKQRSIKTIVSHVEDANVMARMWQMGVNYIQGYHVQEPEVVLLSADPVRG